MSEVQQLVDMGFAEADARQALQQANSDVEQAIERLLTRGTAPGNEPAFEEKSEFLGNVPTGYIGGGTQTDGGVQALPALPPTTLANEDRELDAALEISMHDNPEDLAEDIMQPSVQDRLGCGLRNIGNTCYANSFLQTLMHIDEFRDRMLRYRPPSELPAGDSGAGEAPPSSSLAIAEPEAERGVGEVENVGRKEHCIRLSSELRQLFAYSVLTMRRCIDPTRLLNEVVDERGNKLPIGSQEDVGEFMLKFLERLDEGLRVGEPPPPTEPSAGAAAATAAAPEAEVPSREGAQAPEPPAEAGDEPQPDSEGSPSARADAVAEASAVQKSAEDAKLASEVPAEANAQDASPEEPALKAQAPAAQAHAASATHAGADAGKSAASTKPAETSNQAKKSSLLQSLFFGQQVQVFSYRESPSDAAAHGEEVEKTAIQQTKNQAISAPSGLFVSEEKSEFLQIFLDVKHKDLYSAWEATSCTEVDYTTPSGAITKASTTIWIERLPKLLFFQMQRVVFDQEKKSQVKLHATFEFDSTIYVDRFLLANKERASAVADKVRDLRLQQVQLKDALRHFEEYEDRGGLAISDVLGWTAQCLKDNASTASSGTSAASEGLAHPHSLPELRRAEETPLKAELRAHSADAIRLLERLRDSCRTQLDALHAEAKRLTAEIEDAYRDLKHCAYELSAIWVHQGNAGSGHYWAYLKDWRRDRWLRYDDSVVSVVTWPEVREASVGQSGSITSAYVLVYISRELAQAQSKAEDPQAYHEQVEALLPERLKKEISDDNLLLVQEQRQRQERLAEQLLRQHAEAIFQEYAVFIHKWGQLKQTCESGGNPHDLSTRKRLHDAALLSFECFLYRCFEEKEVWTHLVTQSIDAQRKERNWKPEVEGKVLFFLAGILRSRKCYASMLREFPGEKKAELLPIDLGKMTERFDVLRTQAHVIDEALAKLQRDPRNLVESIGALAYIWAHFDLEADDKFRQNEILLIMSALIYHTVNHLEAVRRPDASHLDLFEEAFEYFLLLLHAVEWPTNWKQPLIQRISVLFPTMPGANHRAGTMPGVTKDAVAAHKLTQVSPSWAELERTTPAEGKEFFERHRALYVWVMENDEVVTQRFVQEMVPGGTFESFTA